MAEFWKAPAPPPPDVTRIVTLGFQLANKLNLYGHGTKSPDTDVSYLVDNVFGTASTLAQLWEFTAADAHDKLSVYKDAGRRDVEDLAARCGKTYVTIIRTIYRASLAAKVVEDVSLESIRVEDLKAARICAISANMNWAMVEDAFETAHNQLRWISASLMLHMQVFDVARLQVKAPRAPGSFDEELASRALASRLLRQREKAATTLVDEYERKADEKARREAREARRVARAERAAAAEAEAAANAENEASKPVDDDAASWKSGVTAKDSRPPSICGDKPVDGEKTKLDPVVEEAQLPPVIEPVVQMPPLPPPEPIDIKLLAPKRRFGARVFSGMAEWFQGLFGRGLPPLDHLELEASVLQGGWPSSSRKPPVLALEPKTLLRQLKRVLRKVGDTPGDQLIGLDAQYRLAVQNAPQRAAKKDGRARNLIAVDTRSLPDFVVVYMSIEPVMEPVQLTDALERKVVLPYEQIRTVNGIRDSIHNRFRDVNRFWPIVRDGSFEILNDDGAVISPEAWEATVKPGAVLTMRLSAFNDSPPFPGRVTWAEPYQPPPPHPGFMRPRPMPCGVPPPGGWSCPPPMAPPMAVHRPPEIINVGPRRPRPPPGRRGPRQGSMLSWMAGCKPPKKKTSQWTASDASSVTSYTSYDSDSDDGENDWELGFEPDFGGELTRERDLEAEEWKSLGKLVALWTNAVDTEFCTDSGSMPWYDDAASTYSVSSGTSSSSSSSDEIIDRD
ncbi:hypothetical protein CSOJ01_02285 [Colletotrichum sojae]|uniref:Ubiquitin-like domain-containing protein n=1 Tax=Colletotrichum sojae TaxID=2175907 RepID=A0A8H6JRN3_9PEZI|nr:hypothetical protein CSOJ01_02285 [Colletotrichum sojae]